MTIIQSSLDPNFRSTIGPLLFISIFYTFFLEKLTTEKYLEIPRSS